MPQPGIACRNISVSSADTFAAAVGRAGELGFTDVVVHWTRASTGMRAPRRGRKR